MRGRLASIVPMSRGAVRLLRLRRSVNLVAFVSPSRTAGLAFVLLAANGAGGQTSARAESPAHTSSAPRYVAISNERSHDITLLDGATMRPVATIPVGARARGIRVGHDRRTLMVALSHDVPQTPGPNDGIAIVDLVARRVVRRIPAGTDPEQFAVTPDGRRIYAANEDAGTASAIDARSGRVLKALAVGTEPEGVTVSPDGRWVYVTGETSNTVSVIEVAKDRVVSTFFVDSRPRSSAFSPDGRFAFVPSEVGGSVARVDARRHLVLSRARIGTGEEKPVDIAVSPDGARVYVTLGGADAMVALDARSLREIARVRVGRRPWGLALSPDGRLAYTANGRSDDLSVVDLSTMKVVQTVKVGTRPWGVAVVR